MSNDEQMIPLAEATRQVEMACRRLALLHLAFAETLVKEFGDVEGRRLTIKAIENYSRKIGQKKRETARARGFEPTPENAHLLREFPSIGVLERREEVMVDGEKRGRGWGCVMSQVWHEYGQDGLGRIYCYTDPASTMALNPGHKLIHTATVPDGSAFCELVMRPTTEEERREFAAGTTDWASIDR